MHPQEITNQVLASPDEWCQHLSILGALWSGSQSNLQEEASFKLNLDGWGQHIRVLKNSRELALKLEPKGHTGQYWVGMPKEVGQAGIRVSRVMSARLRSSDLS